MDKKVLRKIKVVSLYAQAELNNTVQIKYINRKYRCQ